jgi:cyclophilin family peptidyl-prolyl cis-trans isomerase/HEAT repeat protein
MRRTKSLASALGWVAVCATSPAPATAARTPAPAPPPRIERLARILQLEDERSSGAGELERLLHDPDPGIRRRAALAAGRIGDVSLLQSLIELMNDGEPRLRRMAALSLGLVGDRAAVERLQLALRLDPDAGVRGRAAVALGRIGDARVAPDIARLVVDSLPKTISRMTVRGDDPGNPLDSWAEQRFALGALARLRDAAAAQYVLLVEGRPRFDWWAASWLAEQLASPALRPVLVAAAASDDARSRVLGARGLAHLKDVSSVELLVSLTRDRNELVAAEALAALAAIGDPRGTVAAAALLGAPSDVVRHAALRSLAVLPPDPGLRARIVTLVAERDPWIRAAAFGALARTSPEDFTLVLSGMDPDASPEVRAAIAAALGALGNEASVVALSAMLKDEDARVVAAVLGALRRTRGADARETLLRYLAEPDLGVRVAAAREIEALGAKGQAEPLLAAWRRGLGDGDQLEARLSALSALVGAGDGEARAAVERIAREDPSRAVRAQASRALGAGGLGPGELGLEPVARPALDWRAAMAPYDPRADRALYTPRVFLYTRRGRIEIRLDVVEAPFSAASFVALARRGFYDGLAFQHVEPGVVVQGGGPRVDGLGGPGYALRDEPGERAFARGAVGILAGARDTGGSQFFITLAPEPQRDGASTAVGWVAAGMDVVDKIRPGDLIERVEVWTGE